MATIITSCPLCRGSAQFGVPDSDTRRYQCGRCACFIIDDGPRRRLAAASDEFRALLSEKARTAPRGQQLYAREPTRDELSTDPGAWLVVDYLPL